MSPRIVSGEVQMISHGNNVSPPCFGWEDYEAMSESQTIHEDYARLVYTGSPVFETPSRTNAASWQMLGSQPGNPKKSL